jgi:hypothetical protein
MIERSFDRERSLKLAGFMYITRAARANHMDGIPALPYRPFVTVCIPWQDSH